MMPKGILKLHDSYQQTTNHRNIHHRVQDNTADFPTTDPKPTISSSTMESFKDNCKVQENEMIINADALKMALIDFSLEAPTHQDLGYFHWDMLV